MCSSGRIYSLISSGTETASIHQEGVLKEVADNPSHLRKIWDVMKTEGPVATIAKCGPSSTNMRFWDIPARAWSRTSTPL